MSCREFRAEDSLRLRVISLFLSIDGEVNGCGQGTPAFFIRLAGCNLRCWQAGAAAIRRIPSAPARR